MCGALCGPMTLIQRSIVHLRWLSTIADFCGEMLRVLRLKPVSTRGGPEVVRVRVRPRATPGWGSGIGFEFGSGSGSRVRVRGFECDHGLQYWSTGDLRRMAVLQTHPHYWTKRSWGPGEFRNVLWVSGPMAGMFHHTCAGASGILGGGKVTCFCRAEHAYCYVRKSCASHIYIYHIWDLGWITLPCLPFTLQHATLHYFVLHYVAQLPYLTLYTLQYLGWPCLISHCIKLYSAYITWHCLTLPYLSLHYLLPNIPYTTLHTFLYNPLHIYIP